VNDTPQVFGELERISDTAVKAALKFLWDRIGLLYSFQGPESGTLAPDTKPQGLGVRDAGRLFYAQDYNRIYRWTGSAWEDAPGQPTRFMIAFFASPPEPVTGWRRCDGRATTRSTEAGLSVYYTAPDLVGYMGQSAWIRV
jgi:hypothetical protein